MIKLQTMDEFLYDDETRILTHLPTGTSYSNYLGVGKVSTYGRKSIIEKLQKIHGIEKTKIIIENSINRGNYIHKKTQGKNFIPSLGHPVCQEVFVYGSFANNLPDVQGSLDSLYLDIEGKLHIVEIKTKSHKKVWEKYKTKSIGSYFRQVAAYKYLFEQFYGLRIESCSIHIIFSSGETSETIHLSQEDYEVYLSQFIYNLRNMAADLN